MGSIERVMMRDAIAQILADAGINRETLPGIVREIITERVDKAISRVMHEGVDLQSITERTVAKRMDSCVSDAVRRALSKPYVSISIEHMPEPLAKEEGK